MEVMDADKYGEMAHHAAKLVDHAKAHSPGGWDCEFGNGPTVDDIGKHQRWIVMVRPLAPLDGLISTQKRNGKPKQSPPGVKAWKWWW